MHELVLVEIIALPAERSRGRHNPRVVKRKVSGFPTKARAAPGPPACRRFRYGGHIRIVAPASTPIDPAMATPSRRRASQLRAARHAFWLEHVKAWRYEYPLLVHLALRRLMHEASRRAGCDPDSLSFLHAVRIVRRHLPFHAAFSPSPAPPHA